VSQPRRLIVAITGASGTVYGVRLLEALRAAQVETHLLLSAAGVLNAQQELGFKRGDIEARAAVVHNVADLGATIASGSFRTDGMVIAPCSMKTLAAVAHGLSDNLIARAADVCLKERRRLVLLTREAPLNLAHIRNMEAVTLMGGVIFPPVPAFYQRPATIDAMVDHTVARVLDLFSVEHALATPWDGRITAPDPDADKAAAAGAPVLRVHR
jgi:4-hydroxy-3-polyprenylbenzoate decarboxylase